MKVYVETNFICEIAFSQEQSRACKDLLAAAAIGLFQLAVPAFSLLEAGRALETSRLKQNQLQPLFAKLFRDYRRSEISGEHFTRIERELVALLATNQELHVNVLRSVRQQLLDHALVLPTTVDAVRSALELESRFVLSIGDATVAGVRSWRSSELATN